MGSVPLGSETKSSVQRWRTRLRRPPVASLSLSMSGISNTRAEIRWITCARSRLASARAAVSAAAPK